MKPTIFHPQADDEFAEAVASTLEKSQDWGIVFTTWFSDWSLKSKPRPNSSALGATARDDTLIVNFRMR